MIVVVEGPSAAGKTTWARRWGDRTVAEPDPADPPNDLSTDETASFFLRRSADRWSDALAVEAGAETAVCDGDPLKLHYDYCVARVGAGAWDRFETSARRCRPAIEQHRIGIADLIVCSFPDDETLERQKEGDATRTRHRFELHRRLGPPLRDWYTALDRLDPGRVSWSFPGALPTGPSRHRYDLDLFDEWMASVPR